MSSRQYGGFDLGLWIVRQIVEARQLDREDRAFPRLAPDGDGSVVPIAGASVIILKTPLPPATTDDSGMYLISAVPEGIYSVQASATNFVGSSALDLVVHTDVVVNFPLNPGAARSTPDGNPSRCNHVPVNLVANCGFETGDLNTWSQLGDISFTVRAIFALIGCDCGR